MPIDWDAFEHSPITGIHLWFDRPVTDLPHATLLDRTIQWMFNKSEGRYIQVVVSASRSLLETPRNEIIDLAVRELAEFFPAVKEARLEKAQVIKEVRATFSAKPGHGSTPPAIGDASQQLLPRRRLDAFRLAGHHGRRRPQRLPRGRSGCRRSGMLRSDSCCRISHNRANDQIFRGGDARLFSAVARRRLYRRPG